MLWRVQSSDATLCERVRRGWHGASASQHFWFAQGQGQPYTVAVHMWCARSQGGHQLTLPRRGNYSSSEGRALLSLEIEPFLWTRCNFKLAAGGAVSEAQRRRCLWILDGGGDMMARLVLYTGEGVGSTAVRMPKRLQMASPSTTHARLVMSQTLSTTGPAHAKAPDVTTSA